MEPNPRLSVIDAEIATDRAAYLRATWAGHGMEADYLEDLIDHLVWERDDLIRAAWLATGGLDV